MLKVSEKRYFNTEWWKFNVQRMVMGTTSNVPVKSKLKHSPPPPRAYPGHLTSFPAREGGNLMNLVFPGAGHLITTHRGWGIWLLASISCYITLIPGGVIHCKSWRRPALMHSERKIPDSWQTRWKAKACTSFALYWIFQEPVVVSSACKSVVY